MKVAINGFGRIGRLVFRKMLKDKEIEVVAINDLTDSEQLAYLLKYDTSHRLFNQTVSHDENNIIVNGKKTPVFKETDPANLPWGELNVDVVFECTGRFTAKEDAEKHLKAGAKKVIISAPAKGDVKTVVYGVNENILTKEDNIISAASCTTNCLAPVLNVINKEFKIEKGLMTTVHAYTNDQSLLDLPHKKGIESRRGRAAASNIVPTSTGAAKAIGLVIPSLNGKLKGGALRVPTTTGSMIDLTLELSKKVTKEEINKLIYNNQTDTLEYTKDPIVSSDIIGNTHGCIFDSLLTDVLEVEEKQLVKLIAWYDNEMGYSAQMIRTAKYLNEK